MSLFGRRERKRIAALEKENRDLRENLFTAQIDMPSPMRMFGIRKGVWYQVSYQFRGGDVDGGMAIDTRQHFVGEMGGRPYFEGESSASQWTGEPQ